MSIDHTRYARQIALNGFGIEGQTALSNAHVVCIGAGGLGSPAALYLAAAGVGKITIIDDDVVDRSNLQRQILHSDADVGRPKVESAAQRLHALNPDCEILTVNDRFVWPNCMDLCSDSDVIIDGSDNFDTRYTASTTAARLGIPHVWGAILGFQAQLSIFDSINGPVYEDVFPHPPMPGDVPNCAEGGVLGPLVGVVGSAMALEAIKVITGIGKPLKGNIGYFDGITGLWEYIPIIASANTRDILQSQTPRHTPRVSEVTKIDPELYSAIIDVREPEETRHGVIPGARLVPLSLIEAAPQETLRLIPHGSLLYCAAGVRSMRACLILEKAGAHGLKSLAGGIAAVPSSYITAPDSGK
ncbi:ThiF family adenylyltransferase [Corynebacterium pseudotuberculosis]|uniref:ThiF family adenylyltransferase n=1 Tax=Corynebacterium pseudotuberculosis TaxID=1719 RepID=UPI0006945A8F|nr:ThiF family adenylyltransferase [Corynebacterium pseudotuberculosis]AMN69448.1 molybdopterin biosynthesis protein MoeB [Corynebacterium pseudotuberculosis]AMN71294.1 molybdopterin biosynthesis protein MoeB [Corynebacterium pseudotuberculosis]AMN74057.1 molybdopterin biosynthesis protein MoeB [Corynebacterium pseudotuberculosis]AMN75196.1 molybdopterin biosynthesis protein MoeB [Corynebacterium pseudotuberculosis]ANZ91354.1 molybdopterin biosynthesis protein MoeB [Corynebacterium pseudotuber